MSLQHVELFLEFSSLLFIMKQKKKMQAIQQSINKAIKIPEVSQPTGFHMVFQKLQHDHVRVYYSFATMGPYHTFSFNNFFFHLTTCHETSPTRTSVYLHYILKQHKATTTVLTNKRYTFSILYKCFL